MNCVKVTISATIGARDIAADGNQTKLISAQNMTSQPPTVTSSGKDNGATGIETSPPGCVRQRTAYRQPQAIANAKQKTLPNRSNRML